MPKKLKDATQNDDITRQDIQETLGYKDEGKVLLLINPCPLDEKRTAVKIKWTKRVTKYISRFKYSFFEGFLQSNCTDFEKKKTLQKV